MTRWTGLPLRARRTTDPTAELGHSAGTYRLRILYECAVCGAVSIEPRCRTHHATMYPLPMAE